MEYKSFCSCLFAVLLGLITSSQAYKFYVGGKDGWVLKPSESYNHWAERMRFQVNDTLYFKYNKDSNSVLVVNKDDYYSCNTKYPIQSLSDGDSVFHFNRSGPHYFISGNADNCNNGQKVIIVVMAVRHHHHHHAPPSPSPAAASPLASSSPASHPSLSPPVESPHTSTPPSTLTEPPKSSSGNSSDIDSPAPAPSKSGSAGLASSAGSVLGFSVVASVVLGSLIGVF
ncbi:early nodulin-like protein 1 [Pistacia vera]|uniref:early nodulin-like protein 1 n=1 Tax=Pistacia vera TaxID=55513 RepID=UPI001262AEB2|nr:early nodulin-like protein 1 [Pistacia vera]